MEPITTERLIIRRARPTDSPDFLAYQTHPDSLAPQEVEEIIKAAGFDLSVQLYQNLLIRA